MKTVAILLAAGQGKRMNSAVRKQYMEICERPVLYYSLKTLQNSFVDEIILVAAAGEEAYLHSEYVQKYGFDKVSQIVQGGKERYHSVYRGIQAVKEADYCFIHDGARPFLTQEILERALESVKQYQACVVAMPSKDTVKIADEDGFVASTPKRSQVWNIQTPQVFSCEMIRKAYALLMENEEKLLSQGVAITDDAMVVETFMDIPVRLVEGSYDNIKITTPEDIALAESILRKKQENLKSLDANLILGAGKTRK